MSPFAELAVRHQKLTYRIYIPRMAISPFSAIIEENDMKRPDYLVSGEFSRLIPVAIKPELRNTSVTCAILMAVEEFATG